MAEPAICSNGLTEYKTNVEKVQNIWRVNKTTKTNENEHFLHKENGNCPAYKEPALNKHNSCTHNLFEACTRSSIPQILIMQLATFKVFYAIKHLHIIIKLIFILTIPQKNHNKVD